LPSQPQPSQPQPQPPQTQQQPQQSQPQPSASPGELAVDVVVAAQDADPDLGPLRAFLLTGQSPADATAAATVQSMALTTQLDDLSRVCLRIPADGSLRLFVPLSLRTDLLTRAHDDPTSGHLAISRTYSRLVPAYYWPGMHADVARWCASCTTCLRRKTPRTAPPGLLQPITSTHPWELVVMDFLGPLPETSSGNKYVLVIADHFSKWVELFPLPTASATATANSLVDIICRFGAPETLLSDQGTHFTATLVSETCSLLGIHRRTGAAYHPQTQGLVERFNATLLDMVSSFTSSHQRDWDTHLRAIAFAYNTSEHATTGLSPYEVLFGTAATAPFDAALRPPRTDVSPDVVQYVNRLQQQLADVRALVDNRVAQQQDRQRIQYDRHHRDVAYAPGDVVYLYTPRPRKGISPKLQMLWTGPWRIVERVNRINYVIEGPLPTTERRLVPVTRLKPSTERSSLAPPQSQLAPQPQLAPPQPQLASPPHPQLTPSPSQLAPPSHLATQPPPQSLPPGLSAPPQPPTPPAASSLPDGYFLVDRLLDRRRAGRGYRYLVRWDGYDSTHDSWEPRASLPRHLVDGYDRTRASD
jgi:transposase InsO family protein